MLSVRRTRVCRGLGYASGIAALVHIASIVIASHAPSFLSTDNVCRQGGCALTSSVAGLLSGSMRVVARVTPDAATALERCLTVPHSCTIPRGATRYGLTDDRAVGGGGDRSLPAGSTARL